MGLLWALRVTAGRRPPRRGSTARGAEFPRCGRRIVLRGPASLTARVLRSAAHAGSGTAGTAKAGIDILATAWPEVPWPEQPWPEQSSAPQSRAARRREVRGRQRPPRAQGLISPSSARVAFNHNCSKVRRSVYKHYTRTFVITCASASDEGWPASTGRTDPEAAPKKCRRPGAWVLRPLPVGSEHAAGDPDTRSLFLPVRR